ncbi:hypothetical protein K502DRAFT_252070 [Neoconidiobolus thromboides FSU 785]|nr:hypothetical protein K502DRAFT_252070 [Neoconidiobolus thromboides FSU 785]
MKLRKSCERCFKGKKKCDNLQPVCKRCMKLNVDCVYPFTYNQSLWQLSYKKELKEYEGKELIGIETRLNELEEKFKKVIKKPMKLEQILNGLKKDPESYYEHLQKLLDYQVNLKRDTKFLEHNVFYRHLVTLYYNFQYGITSMISRKLIEEHFEKQASESILLNAIYATTLPLANFISNRPPPRLDLNPFYKRVKIALHEFDLSPTLANVHTHLLNCILEMGMGNFEWAMMSISK